MEEEELDQVVEESNTDSFDKFFNQSGIKGYDEYDDDYDEDEVEEINEVTEEIQEENNEDITDEVEGKVTTEKVDSVDSVTYPSIFELEEKGKKSFSNDKERADYYEGLTKHNHKLLTEDYSKAFIDTYSKELLQSEQDAETLIAMKQALDKGNKLEFLREYFAKDLKRFGFDVRYKDDEINDIVGQELAKKYGEDWEDKFDVNQLKIPTSLSSKIAREQAKIIDRLEAENEKFGSPQQAPVQETISEDVRNQYFENEFKEFNKLGMPKEEFDGFIQQATEYMPKLNLKDMYKIVNFESIISNVREKAIEEGRKLVHQEIKNSGGKSVAEVPTQEPRAVVRKLPKNESDFYSQKKEREMRRFL